MLFQFVIAAAVSLDLDHIIILISNAVRNKVQQTDAVIEIDLIRIGFQLQGTERWSRSDWPARPERSGRTGGGY